MNARRIRPLAALAAAAALAALTFTTAAADEAVAIGVEQVERGAAAYATNCAFCHGAELEGGGFPPLSGNAFVARWNERPVSDLYDYVRTQMPLGAGGTLAPEVYVDLTALILATNGVEPGEAEFTGDDEAVLATPMDLELDD
jgi:mono/diheme cytochrome c family protein